MSTDDIISLDLPNLPTYITNLTSDDHQIKLQATTSIRQLLSLDNDPPIDQVIQGGAVPLLIDILTLDYND